MWKSKFTELIDIHAPFKTRKVGKKVQPWITKEILDSKRNKNFLKKSVQNYECKGLAKFQIRTKFSQ